MQLRLVLGSLACVVLAACSGGLDDQDSVIAFAATSQALSQGQAQAQVAANGTKIVEGEQASFRGLGVEPRASGNVDYDWACTGGGTAHYAGAAEVVVDGAGASNVTFDLAAEFTDCSVNGITISGDLDYAVDVETTADTAYVMSTMKGSLTYDGQIDGSCDWNLTMKVAASGAGAGSVSAEFSGSICGHNAKSTLNVQG